MLSVKDLSLSFGKLVLADHISFDLEPGNIHVIIGPNGTGKSTFLKCLFGDIKPQSGLFTFCNKTLNHKHLSDWRSPIGYMPQDIHLDVGLTVIEVVLLGKLDALSYRIDDQMLSDALNVLEQLGLAHLANRDVRTLSGGQCQMVLFAQVLIKKPQLLMLDEPVSALDLHFQQVLLEHLSQKTQELNCTSIAVLHDLNLAAQYADNLIVLKQGQVLATGSPHDVLTAELIEEAYGVRAQVAYDQQGLPFVRSLRHALS